MAELFTIGYEGKELGDFLAILEAHGVKRVVDIRELPLSRRRGFSKTPLGAALATVGIEYVHLREAGNPYRKLVDRSELLASYRAHLRSSRAVVTHVAEAIGRTPSALLCFEADAATCHRSVLAPKVAKKLGLSITDL